MTTPVTDDELWEALEGLREGRPELSADRTFLRRQRIGLLVALAATALGLALAPVGVGRVLVGGTMVLYLASTLERVVLLVTGLGRAGMLRVSDDAARAIPDDDLPVFTVLLPAYGEPTIMDELLAGVGQLDYPADKLDVKLLLEADDAPTVEAALEGGAARFAEVILVPPAEPRTKPKACNVGLQRARGELVTIYDAEDLPEPLQLRRVVAAFRDADPDVACIQCRLGYFNERQNLLTRWFSVEYDQWFGFVLPNLTRVSRAIPLGGTSNHVRTSLLVEAGGWDPYNVTEDADLGVRLGRLGHRTLVLDSTTLEEANSDPINWVRQRSRWYKGYLQTFLVHARRPRELLGQLGWRGTVRLAALTAGTPLIAVVNVVFAAMALLWFSAQPAYVGEVLRGPVYFASLTSVVVGNTVTIYLGLLTTRLDRKPHLVVAALTIPLYWVMMSAAAIKAIVQLLLQPSYWEKTVHGLTSAAPRDRQGR